VNIGTTARRLRLKKDFEPDVSHIITGGPTKIEIPSGGHWVVMSKDEYRLFLANVQHQDFKIKVMLVLLCLALAWKFGGDIWRLF